MTEDGAAAKNDVTPSDPGRGSRDLLRDHLVGRKIGRYDVLHRIASGGMGSVYIGRARGAGDFERLVAIKVLHQHFAHQEDFVAMFLDEARLAAQIRHPNVVATLDVCPTPEGYFLVMEYVEGDHLGGLVRNAIKAGERLPVPVVLRIGVDSLGGLAAAHDLSDRTGAPLNLVHRDVSPQNVLVGVDGLARLTDFGVAKAEHRLSSTRDGQFKGKLAYTSPEHASTGDVEQRSDLFSMGVVLWEALTGQRLFGAKTNEATLRRLMDAPIPSPSSVDPALAPLDSVLDQALSRDLDGRFQTAHDMIEAIETVAPQVGGIASTRAVARQVRRLAADKLDRERAAVESAVIELARRSDAPPPLDRTEPSHTSIDTVRPGRRRAQRSKATWIAVGVIALVAAAAAAWLATRGEEAPTASAPGATEAPARPEPQAAEPEQDEGQAGAGSEATAGTEPSPGDTVEQPGEASSGGSTAEQETTPAGPETAQERRARLQRLRALRRRRAARARQAMDTAPMQEEPASMQGGDILDNPYRNR